MNNDHGQAFRPNIECLEITLTVIGQRDSSVARGRTTKFSNTGYGEIVGAMEDKFRAHMSGESLRAHQNVKDMTNFASVDVAATGAEVGIINGWQTVRYMVHCIFRSQISSQVSEWVVVQGFTEHPDIMTIKGATQVLFDPAGIIEINKMSFFKQLNNDALTPTGSYNVVLDRWDYNEGLHIIQPNTVFSSVSLMNSEMGILNMGNTKDGRILVANDIHTLSTKNAIGDNYANSLINTAIDANVEVIGTGNSASIGAIAASNTATPSIHTNRLTEAIMAYYADDIAMSVNPHNFTFAFLEYVTVDFDNKVFINGDVNLKNDGYYVLDAGNAQQLSVGDSNLEIKISSMISEATGAIMIENDLKSLSISVLGDKNNPTQPISSKLNGLIEHVIMGTGAVNEMHSAERAMNDLTTAIFRIMQRYPRYVIKVEVFSMVSCAITLRIDMDEPICSTWSLFADSLSGNGLSTSTQFHETVQSTGALMSRIGTDLVFLKEKYGNMVPAQAHNQFSPPQAPVGYNPPSSPASSGTILMGNGGVPQPIVAPKAILF